MVAAFALGLAIGLGALARGVGETPAGDVLLASAALCGLTAATGARMPVALAAPHGARFRRRPRARLGFRLRLNQRRSEHRRQPFSCPASREIIGVRELQAGQFALIGAGNL